MDEREFVVAWEAWEFEKTIRALSGRQIAAMLNSDDLTPRLRRCFLHVLHQIGEERRAKKRMPSMRKERLHAV